MADEVFDRICARVAELQREFSGNPRLYCYGVANNLIKEYHKASKLFVPVEDIDIPAEPPSQAENEFAELREECLSGCLQELSESKRDQILSYYSKTKHEKIILRAEMARQLGISIQTLRVRMNRIRRDLETCIERCLEQYRTAE
jgi:RNA polymerase sigma factor (sigma-70 family)